jgi:hypothetical protein
VRYAGLEVVEVREGPGSFALIQRHLELAVAVEEAGLEEAKKGRVMARDFWRGVKNPLTGGDVVESASPGNYRIFMREGRVAYTWFDLRGGEVRISGS